MTAASPAPPLPVTVISGYLGAGKTSLVNHLLRHAGGRRIMVLVNDFGELAIDADLVESASEDTVTLANGCVCCSIAGELMFALGDALDRRPRPDCLVIEASGVAEPRRIAEVALAEPEMRFGGVVTMADAANLARTLDDPRIGPQVRAQLTAADLVLLTRGDASDATAARERIAEAATASVIEAPFGRAPVDLVLDRPDAAPPPADAGAGHDHGALYASWSHEGPEALPRAAAEAFFRDASGVYRMKGVLRLAEGVGLEAHRVGATVQTCAAPLPASSRIAAIGLAGALDPVSLERRWRRAAEG